MKFPPYLVVLFAVLAFSPAFAADSKKYNYGNLDEIVMLPRPTMGVQMVMPQKLRFRLFLTQQPQPCNTAFIKRAMVMQGTPKEVVEQTPITKCISVRTVKGSTATFFIQDKVAETLSQQVKLGQPVDLLCDFLFLEKSGPGILVNEFQPTK